MKGKTIDVQAWTGHESFRSLRLTDFKTIGTRRWKIQPYEWPSLLPRKCSGYLFHL